MLPNLVWANVAVVNVRGACVRCWRKELLVTPVAGAGLAARFPFFNVGLDDDVGGDPCGEVLGLKLSPFMLELTASIGRKHWASGLKVLVTSWSVDESSVRSLFSEYKIWKWNAVLIVDLELLKSMLFYLHSTLFTYTIRYFTGIYPHCQFRWKIL